VRLIGPRNLHATTEALSDAGARVGRFLIMQTLINGMQGIAVAIGLTLIGVPNAILWGALTLVLRFIPYLGPWLAASMPIALAFAVFDNWAQPLMTVGLFIVLESMTNLVLEPWLYGSQTGVSPVALLVAATFWTWLWGMPGLFLAIPLTVCLVVMGKYIPQLGFLNVLLGDQPALEPHERYYQRLLANGLEQADDLVQETLEASSLVEVGDLLVVPALQLAEVDNQRNVLDDERLAFIRAKVAESVEELAEDGSPLAPRDSVDQGDVLCLPADDEADETAARLLSAALRSRKVPALAASAKTLKAEMLELVSRAQPSVIVLSGIPPSALQPARYLCKRLRTVCPTVPVVVGLWNAKGDLEKAHERLLSAGATHVVVSFAECVERVEAIRSARVVRPPDAPGETTLSGEPTAAPSEEGADKPTTLASA
jgi:hypothetical protein